MYLLNYLPRDNLLYLGDKELNITSFSLQLAVLEYQTAIMRKDFDSADKVTAEDVLKPRSPAAVSVPVISSPLSSLQVLPTIPSVQRTRVAHFLEKQGFKQQALAVSTDHDHK